jgi:hypothetical protein
MQESPRQCRKVKDTAGKCRTEQSKGKIQMYTIASKLTTVLTDLTGLKP